MKKNDVNLSEIFPEMGPDKNEELLSKLDDIKKEEKDSRSKSDKLNAKVDFDLEKISDFNYLNDIFSTNFDKYKSKEYLNKTKKKLLKDGYIDGPMLNEYLFWGTISRRLKILYQGNYAKVEKVNENVALLKNMGLVTDRVSKLLADLDASKARREKVTDIVDIFEKTMDRANEFVKKNIGEFSFRCDKCGAILQTDGAPHHAIMTEKNEKDENVYYIYSPELAYLVKKKIIPLHLMAFILRTSPEGIMFTAKARGETDDEFLNIPINEEEVKLKEILKEFNDD